MPNFKRRYINIDETVYKSICKLAKDRGCYNQVIIHEQLSLGCSAAITSLGKNFAQKNKRLIKALDKELKSL